MMYATIDIGTNSVRLNVAEPTSKGPRIVLSKLTITRLGQDVSATKRLDAAAMERTISALLDYQEVLKGMKLDKIMVIATSAVRDAVNRDDFLSRVKVATGWNVQVLTGIQEAQASFAGAIQALNACGREIAQHVVVVDIGGGSTELIHGLKDGRIIGQESGQIGAVRMTEDCSSLAEMETLIKTRLQPLIAACQLSEPFSLVGVGGTITSLAALEQGLQSYQSQLITGYQLSRATVQAWLERLNNMELAQRRSLPGMTPGREDVIVAGVAICYAVMESLGQEQLIVSDGDLLQGIMQLGIDNFL